MKVSNCNASRFFCSSIKTYHEKICKVKSVGQNILMKTGAMTENGSREEDEISGFFLLSHLWMRG